MTLNELTKTRITAAYELHEDEFLDFLRIVPFADENKQTWSPKLVSILLDCCSLIDSLFRASAPAQGFTTQSGKTIPPKDMNINNFREIFSLKLELSTLSSLVYISPAFLIVPFKEWQNTQTPTNPFWWTAHGDIKHNRLANMHLATMETTLYALCALFEVIVKLPEMSNEILRRNWLSRAGTNPEWLLDSLSREDRKRL